MRTERLRAALMRADWSVLVSDLDVELRIADAAADEPEPWSAVFDGPPAVTAAYQEQMCTLVLSDGRSGAVRIVGMIMNPTGYSFEFQGIGPLTAAGSP